MLSNEKIKRILATILLTITILQPFTDIAVYATSQNEYKSGAIQDIDDTTISGPEEKQENTNTEEIGITGEERRTNQAQENQTQTKETENNKTTQTNEEQTENANTNFNNLKPSYTEITTNEDPIILTPAETKLVNWEIYREPKTQYIIGETLDLNELRIKAVDNNNVDSIFTYTQLKEMADVQIQENINMQQPTGEVPAQVTIKKSNLKDLIINITIKEKEETQGNETTDALDIQTYTLTSKTKELDQENQTLTMNYTVQIKDNINTRDYYTVKLDKALSPKTKIKDIIIDEKLVAFAEYNPQTNTIKYTFTEEIKNHTQLEIKEELLVDTSFAERLPEITLINHIAGKEQKTTHQIKAEELEQKITIQKYDENSKALSGAEFELTNEKNETIETATTNTNGQYQIQTKLEEGIYYLKETKAPEGYKNTEQKIKIYVDKKGKANWTIDTQGKEITTEVENYKFHKPLFSQTATLKTTIKIVDKIKAGDYLNIKIDNKLGLQQKPQDLNQNNTTIAKAKYDLGTNTIKYTFIKDLEKEEKITIQQKGFVVKDVLNYEMGDTEFTNTIGQEEQNTVDLSLKDEIEIQNANGFLEKSINTGAEISTINQEEGTLKYTMLINPDKAPIDRTSTITIKNKDNNIYLNQEDTKTTIYEYNQEEKTWLDASTKINPQYSQIENEYIEINFNNRDLNTKTYIIVIETKYDTQKLAENLRLEYQQTLENSQKELTGISSIEISQRETDVIIPIYNYSSEENAKTSDNQTQVEIINYSIYKDVEELPETISIQGIEIPLANTQNYSIENFVASNTIEETQEFQNNKTEELKIEAGNIAPALLSVASASTNNIETVAENHLRSEEPTEETINEPVNENEEAQTNSLISEPVIEKTQDPYIVNVEFKILGKTNPLKKGETVEFKISEHLNLKDENELEPLKLNNEILATPQYNADTKTITYTAQKDIEDDITIRLVERFEIDRTTIEPEADKVEIVNTLAGNELRSMVLLDMMTTRASSYNSTEINFTITKYNEMKNALKGAEFKVEGDNGYSETIKQTNSHIFEFKDLPLGNYKIIETTVPNGYIEPQSHWEFTVTKDDTGRAIISTPDFPMEIKTDENVVLKGDFPVPYDSQYSDLVRNPFNQSRDLENGKGSINTRIIGKEGTNTYKMEVVVRVNSNQTISNLQIHEVMGTNFNIDKGIDNSFDREDFSLTASDGSFLYIEPGRDSGVYGGEPFGTNKIFTGSKIVYNQSADRISITGTGTDGSGWKVSAGNEQAWIKLTYNVTFDDSKIKSLDDKTFYRVGENSYVKTTANKLGASSPAIRPIIINTQTDPRVDIINTKLPATLELQKVGPKREYNAEGKIVKEELKPLEGAVFELYKSQTTSVSDAISTNRRVISGAKGEITFDNLQRNYVYSTNQQSQTYYWLKELSAPTGYDLINGLVGPFTINYFGGIEYAGGDLKENAGEPGVKINTNGTVREDSAVKYTVNDADKGVYETTLYQIANTRINHKGEIDIFKYDEDGKENPQTNKKPPIEGTQFTIYRVSGEKGENSLENWTGTKVETKATDKSGKAQFINLEEGYYRLEETKPADGYIKSDKVWQIKVDNEGFTSIVQVHPQTQNKAANTNTGFRSAFRSAGLFSPRAFSPMNLRNATDIGADVVSKIEASHYLGLYSAGDHEYIYTDKIDNHTGFTEKYQNPTKTTELYSFNGVYKDKTLNNVAGVNKYVVPTGKPGEYEVHVRVAGNRVDSTTGIVLAYDNSNSMRDNNRIVEANKAITNFVGKLVKPGDDSTKVAMVTYGSQIFDQFGKYEFTNNPKEITDKLPQNIPSERRLGEGGGTYTQGALVKAQSLFEGTNFDNKIIITISDGVPTFSHIPRYIDETGNYIWPNSTFKTGTGNRFMDPYSAYPNGRHYTGAPYTNNIYRSYYLIDRRTTYDEYASYARYTNTAKFYINESGQGGFVWDALPRPLGGYGYKLISNHGYATIEQGKQIKASGIQMYTIGIQIDKSNISGTTTPDATRDNALEVMFGISSSKDTYFDAQNLNNLDTYLSQILAELEEKKPPTVNRGILTDPMGPMVLLDKGSGNNQQVYSLRDVGKKPIPREILDAIKVDYTGDRQINMSNLNLSRDQEIELVYKVHLNTEAPGYKKDTMYETNGTTTLQPNGDYADKKWQLPLPKISGPDTSMMLTKIWQDAEGNTPSETHPVKVQLQRKLVGSVDSTYKNVGAPTPITSPDWNTYFERLIPFDNNGNVYEYRVLEVNPDGKYSVLFEGNGYSRTIINRERQTQDVYNKINKIDFVKRDKLSEKVMPGVTFHLRKLVNGENQIVTRDGQEIYESVVSDTNGKIHFEKLAPGTYNIMEDTPKGYEEVTNPVKTFIVGEDGVIRTDQSRVITEDDLFKTIYNTPIMAELKLKKIDGSTSQPLQGAKFKLYIGPSAETATEVIEGKIYESNVDGIIDIGELRTEVQYWLEEVEAPEGYQENPGKISIIMFDKTHISVNGQKIDDYSLENPPLISNYKEITAELAIQKVKKDESGTLDALSGATWKITQADGTEINPVPVAQRITKEGQWPYGTFSKLKEGSYKIVEQTAPNGYLKFKGYFILEVKSESNQVTSQKTNYINKITRFENEQDTPGTIIYDNRQITDQGKDHMITVKGVDGETDVVGFRVVNDPNKLQIKKVDSDSKETILEGVSFELLYESTEDIKEVTGTLANGKQVPLRKVHENHLLDSNLNTEVHVVRTTNESGLIVFDRLPKNISGGHEVKYYLKEIKTKDGYQLSKYFIGPFTVTSDSITGPDGNVIDGDVPFEVENYKKPDLQITKVDENTKDKLAGAIFRLYKAPQNDDMSYNTNPKEAEDTGKEITTGDGSELGIAKFEQIDEGLYWIKEISASTGYANPLKDFGPYLVEKDKIYKVELNDYGFVNEDTKDLLTKISAVNERPVYTETIDNSKAVYPATGGPGTMMYSMIGLGIMAAGVAIYARKNKREEEIEE